jgi:hypothetical protein
MWITLDEAIVIYARYCSARFGDAAGEKVKATAISLRNKGDLEGHRVWTQVAEQIEKRRAKAAPRVAELAN